MAKGIENTDIKDSNKQVICIFGKKDIIYFQNTSEAAKTTGIPRSNISACCRGVRKSAGGCNWFFQTDTDRYAELLNRTEIDAEKEIQKILNYYAFSLEQIRSSTRRGRYTICRTSIYKYLREVCGWKFTDIGKLLNRKSSTVSKMIKNFNELLSVNDKIAVRAWLIVEEICITEIEK